MAIKKLVLTEDHLKLIKNLNFEKFKFNEKQKVNQLKDCVYQLDLKDDSKAKEKNESILREIDEMDFNERFGWGMDQWNLFGGTYVLEDIAMIIGKFDQAIKGTEENPSGRRFPEELEEYMLDLYRYIYDNMEYIISLLLQYSSDGGISAGTYKCVNNIKKWEKID